MFSLNYKHNRIFGLDILRAVAILAVVVNHGLLIFSASRTEQRYVPWLDGVEIFFVLSGFLIGQIIFEKVLRNEFQTRTHLFTFWRFRWFRTLPNYYLILIVNIVLAFLGLTRYKSEAISWKFWFFLQNVAGPFQGFFPESWSLAVEEWFYLVFPLALVMALAAFKGKNQRLISLGLLLLFIAVPLWLRFQFALSADFQSFNAWGKEVRQVVIYRLDSVMFGVLMAWVFVFYESHFVRHKYLLLAIGLLLNAVNYGLNGAVMSVWAQAFYLPINGFSMALCLPYFASLKTGKGIVFQFITYVSVISYAMYVVHYSIVLMPMRTFLSFGTSWATAYFLLYLAATFLLSHVLYRFYEKPMTDLRSR